MKLYLPSGLIIIIMPIKHYYISTISSANKALIGNSRPEVGGIAKAHLPSQGWLLSSSEYEFLSETELMDWSTVSLFLF